jgi:hypothetical protein
MITITSRRCQLLWKFRKSTITISSELHDKVRQSCAPIDEVQSEVIRVRPAPNKKRKVTKMNSDHVLKYRI